MKIATILFSLLISFNFSFGQNLSRIGKIFFNIPIDSSFQYLCNNIPIDTNLFLLNELKKGTIQSENYSITYFNCNGFNLIIKDTTFYNSKRIEFFLGQDEFWKDDSTDDTASYGDNRIWKGAAFSLNFKYTQFDKKLAYADFEKLIALIKETGYNLKKIKYGKGLGMQWEKDTKELRKENAAKIWENVAGKRVYLDNNIYPTIQLELIKYLKTKDKWTYEIHFLYRKP
jgi:hypothetical protein